MAGIILPHALPLYYLYDISTNSSSRKRKGRKMLYAEKTDGLVV